MSKCGRCGRSLKECFSYGCYPVSPSPAPSKPEHLFAPGSLADAINDAAEEGQEFVLRSAYDAKCAEVEDLQRIVSEVPALRSQLSEMREYAMKRDSELAFSQSQLAEAKRDAERWRALLAHTVEDETVDVVSVPDWHTGWVFLHDEESMAELAALALSASSKESESGGG